MAESVLRLITAQRSAFTWVCYIAIGELRVELKEVQDLFRLICGDSVSKRNLFDII